MGDVNKPPPEWPPHDDEPRGCPTPGACSAAEEIKQLRSKLAAAEARAEKASAKWCEAFKHLIPDQWQGECPRCQLEAKLAAAEAENERLTYSLKLIAEGVWVSEQETRAFAARAEGGE